MKLGDGQYMPFQSFVIGFDGVDLGPEALAADKALEKETVLLPEKCKRGGPKCLVSAPT